MKLSSQPNFLFTIMLKHVMMLLDILNGELLSKEASSILTDIISLLPPVNSITRKGSKRIYYRPKYVAY